MEKVIIRTHGAAKSDPGAAAIAVQLVDGTGKVLIEKSEAIGNSTNLHAAFMAVARGVSLTLDEFGEKSRDMDFTLVVSNEEVHRLLNGESPVTNPGIVPYFIEIYNLKVEHFPHLSCRYVPTGENEATVKLVEEALDAR